MNPVLMIGKKGLTDEVVTSLDKALLSHELLKLKLIDYKENRDELSREAAERTNARLVRVIGNTAIFYRPNPDPDRREISLP